MRTYLNLSSRPFTNHRIFWIAVMAVFFISLWLLLWVSTERNVVSAKIDQISRRISAQEELVKQAELDRVSRSQLQQDIQLDDQQKMQLAAARQLISLKAFSWNRLVSDIEAHTPKDARILSIKGDELSNGQQAGNATVEIKALGKTAAQMTEMMESLEKSGGLFVILQSGQEALSDTGEVPFALELVYNPYRGSAQ
jgi:hypothetical protein